MFYGIIVRMYFAPSEHHPPHFHVYYAEYKGIVDIRTCEISEGNFPKKQTKLVLAWTELHQDELMADWDLVMNAEVPFNPTFSMRKKDMYPSVIKVIPKGNYNILSG